MLKTNSKKAKENLKKYIMVKSESAFQFDKSYYSKNLPGEFFPYKDNDFKVGDIYNDILTGNYFDELADPDENFYEWLLDEYEDVFLDDNEEED